MKKEELRREDGRYLIYYWFDAEPRSSQPAGGESDRSKSRNEVTIADEAKKTPPTQKG